MPEPELLGSAEVAELLGVTKQTLANWRARNRSFPDPLAELRSGPVWNREQVLNWARSEGISIATGQTKAHRQLSAKLRNATVVAVVNMKGGVGKSTITANLGWYCAYKKNKRVLLIDLDPQFNLTQYALGSDKYGEIIKKRRPTVYDIFEQTSVSPIMRQSPFRPEDAICEVRAWADGSRLDIVPSRLDLSWTLKSSYDKKEHLHNFIEKIRKLYDLILVDCPPTQSVLTDAAYYASDFVLIPVKPEFLSTIGLPLLAKSLEDYKSQHPHHSIEIAGIVFNAVVDQKAEHEKSKRDVAKVAKANGWYIFENEIRFSDSYPKGSREGKPIFLTQHARWDKVFEFEALANEFSQRVGL